MVKTVSLTAPSKPTIHPPPPTLDEDTIDDLLYFSRTGELEDLQATVAELSKSQNRYSLEIPAAAVDPFSGNTCLHMAAANNHVNVVEYILSLEAPPLATPVVHPEVSASAAGTEGILSGGKGETAADVISIPQSYLSVLLNFPNNSGNTPLHWACLNGHLETVKVLVKAGADPGVLNGAGHDCVYEAEVNDKSKVVEWVLEYAETLESGVGFVGEDDKKDEGDEEEQQQDNADVLRDEGRNHEEKEAEAEAEVKEGESGIAIDKLDLGDKEPTIR
ncbi:hypothetical protein H072_6262 [Dactylellina haptotyla CBS 200.50]|uniref:Uncharacterized protein n=1 Tax=Dactylellina haptotyla (strain CBS 200.50) TaxID=1284197 RepID=S8BKH0_DACHA|nr:hypothetical protein H072_6262 [Dactylellina haptotyla CBS 200.50]